MGPLTGLSKLSRLSLLSLIATTLPPSQALEIISRQSSTCGGNTNLFQCGASFPTDFCCPTGTTCTPINGTSTVAAICCPSGADCSFIKPIVCDVSQLDPKAHPDNQVHLADTSNVDLPKCGDGCCPTGYSCNGGACSADQKTASPSGSPSASSTSTPSPSATDPASASQTTDPAPAPIVKQSSGFDGKSFAAGFFPGIVLGGLLIVGLIWAVKKRREYHDKHRFSGDFGDHVARNISDPIYDPAYAAARTDFVRRGSQSAQASPNTIEMVKPVNQTTGGGMTPRIKSLWARSPRIGFGNYSSNSPKTIYNNPNTSITPPAPAVRAGNAADPYRTPGQTPNKTLPSNPRPTNPRPENRRSNSTGTIDVLMPAPPFLEPPRAAGMKEHRFTADSGHTTFTKLMERAGYGDEDRGAFRSPGQAR
ncbi:hypothetical protein BDV96DRAFT_503551 [Lophiotrema nucula]|uniref:Mid2 domain-containing protein n=1 Tax=Lophiotrema nucula TaxID=690887 RepID=A0A6A5YS75_9PLEO|nr:hypothetical protein BDV96DRAFT_503551 [Lophiotrema nucula]